MSLILFIPYDQLPIEEQKIIAVTYQRDLFYSLPPDVLEKAAASRVKIGSDVERCPDPDHLTIYTDTAKVRISNCVPSGYEHEQLDSLIEQKHKMLEEESKG